MRARTWSITCTLIFSLAWFHLVAWMIFQHRNPTANAMTTLTHYKDAITFQRLPEFQPAR
jgi:hypothetical protein